MYKTILAASFALISGAAGASTVFIQNGSVIDFSEVAVGSTSRVNVEFTLGDTGRDESVNFILGPTFDLISGKKKPFSFSSVMCDEIGIGLACYADAVFTPKSRKDFTATYEISAIINFLEIHDDEGIYEYSDAFRVSLRGTGIAVAAVPLPSTALGLFSAIGILGWLARRRKAVGPTTRKSKSVVCA